MPSRLSAPQTCVSCREFKPHHSRHLCNACYKHHQYAGTLHKFPCAREVVSSRARYDAWVASGLSCREFARQVGIWETSLARALRNERRRRQRKGLSWLDGWRRECS